jgi:hypothetical protein
MLTITVATDTGDLDAFSFDTEADLLGMIGYGGFDLQVIQFGRLAATLADKKLRTMVEPRVVATDKGIQGVDAMNELVLE